MQRPMSLGRFAPRENLPGPMSVQGHVHPPDATCQKGSRAGGGTATYWRIIVWGKVMAGMFVGVLQIINFPMAASGRAGVALGGQYACVGSARGDTTLSGY